jgi:hypothetical protein
MKRREFIAGLGSTAAAQLAVMPGVAQPLSKAERPEIRVGDSSVFLNRDLRTGEKRETRFHVIAVDGDKIVTETAGNTSGTQTFTRDWNLMEVRTGDIVSQTAKPFWPRLRFPLTPGLKWDSPFEVEVRTKSFKRDAKWQWKAQVAAVGQVMVPAGTYQAFRIEYEASFATRQGNRSWTGTHKETAWYAPQVMRIVRREFEQSAPANKFFDHHVIELLSFTPAQ